MEVKKGPNSETLYLNFTGAAKCTIVMALRYNKYTDGTKEQELSSWPGTGTQWNSEGFKTFVLAMKDRKPCRFFINNKESYFEVKHGQLLVTLYDATACSGIEGLVLAEDSSQLVPDFSYLGTTISENFQRLDEEIKNPNTVASGRRSVTA